MSDMVRKAGIKLSPSGCSVALLACVLLVATPTAQVDGCVNPSAFIGKTYGSCVWQSCNPDLNTGTCDIVNDVLFELILSTYGIDLTTLQDHLQSCTSSGAKLLQIALNESPPAGEATIAVPSNSADDPAGLPISGRRRLAGVHDSRPPVTQQGGLDDYDQLQGVHTISPGDSATALTGQHLRRLQQGGDSAGGPPLDSFVTVLAPPGPSQSENSTAESPSDGTGDSEAREAGILEGLTDCPTDQTVIAGRDITGIEAAETLVDFVKSECKSIQGIAPDLVYTKAQLVEIPDVATSSLGVCVSDQISGSAYEKYLKCKADNRDAGTAVNQCIESLLRMFNVEPELAEDIQEAYLSALATCRSGSSTPDSETPDLDTLPNAGTGDIAQSECLAVRGFQALDILNEVFDDNDVEVASTRRLLPSACIAFLLAGWLLSW